MKDDSVKDLCTLLDVRCVGLHKFWNVQTIVVWGMKYFSYEPLYKLFKNSIIAKILDTIWGFCIDCGDNKIGSWEQLKE